MRPINTSTFDFPTLIQRGFVYVDKTRQIYELARQDTDSIYFFPPPFAGDPRPVYYVGVNFSPRKNIRTVNDVVCELAAPPVVR